MKFNKFVTSLLVASALVAGAAFAEDGNSLHFSISADAAWYPSVARNQNVSSGFAGINGPFGGAEGRVTGAANYTIPTPLGENWLVSSANVNLKGSFELTPVSIKPGFEVSFTPLPFLVFATGVETGTGWSMLGFKGMGSYNASTGSYDNFTPFTHWYYNFYAQGTFQFDTGALIPGDWTHVVMMATYQLNYKGMSGMDAGQVWLWQNSGNKVNGLGYYASIILAYQMPLPLYRVGVWAEFEGHYSDDYAASYKDYDGKFMDISISPLLQFQFTPNDTLATVFGFSSRRIYESYDSSVSECSLKTVGREWYFKRIALSYSHSF